MIGVPGPRLSPEFSPVIESTEFGRSLPRLVASATASRICCFIQIWLAPTGTFTSKVGMPVSWQIGPSQDSAWSMFCAMIVIAWPARVARSSDASAALIASRTSGGRSVEVRVSRLTRLSRKSGSIPSSIIEEKMRGASRRTPARSTPWRIERDPLGEVRVPAEAYYGVQTERAGENFPISGLKAHAELVTATVHIKRAMALANASLGRMDRAVAKAIVQAADEILGGALRDQFVVDVYQ